MRLSPIPIKADKLRALAITGAKRSSAAPDVPTIAEAGVPSYDVTTWQGVLVPARTPKKIVARLHAEFVKILRMPDVRQRLSGEGFDLLGGTPEEFGALIRADIEKWAKVVRQSGIRID